jgi:hypothetical protein
MPLPSVVVVEVDVGSVVVVAGVGDWGSSFCFLGGNIWSAKQKVNVIGHSY